MLESDAEKIKYLWERIPVIGEERVNEILKQMARSGQLINMYRNIAYPQWNDIGVMTERHNFSSLPVGLVFLMCDIDFSRVWEVYAKDREERSLNNGFTEQGKQALADILQKPVRYYHSSEMSHFTPETGEGFYPEKFSGSNPLDKFLK